MTLKKRLPLVLVLIYLVFYYNSPKTTLLNAVAGFTLLGLYLYLIHLTGKILYEILPSNTLASLISILCIGTVCGFIGYEFFRLMITNSSLNTYLTQANATETISLVTTFAGITTVFLNKYFQNRS